ncbi:MAG: hypothetical protein ACRDTH_24125 [Pseudonocardiaceae bacterium]
MIHRSIPLPPALLKTATFLAPLLDATVLAPRAPRGSVGDICPAGQRLAEYAFSARPAALRGRVTCSSAVYVAWDSRLACRYVGSVARGGPTAVPDRVAEHLDHSAAGRRKRSLWALLTVLPIGAAYSLETVRAAEGWAARLLAPMDGSAHPRVDLAAPPITLARLSLKEPQN